MKREISKWGAWVEAARPKTLPASVSPVIVGTALAVHDGLFRPGAALLCLLVALFAQVASNFANDYFDFRKGADRAGRLGPARAVASGWITPRAMLRGTFAALALACACGCALLLYAGWILLPVGVAMALCVLAYSPLAYRGLGDVCVLFFYGIIPVCFTYYVQALSFSDLSLYLALAIGLLSTNILIVNNYRDYEQDRASGKRTTIVRFGLSFGRGFYLANGVLAFALTIPLFFQQETVPPVWGKYVLVAFFSLFYITWRELGVSTGRELNQTLANTARNVLVFALILAAILLFRK